MWRSASHISSLIWPAPWAREPFGLVNSLCSYSVGLGTPHRAPWAQGRTQRALAGGAAVLIAQLLSCVQAAPWGLVAPWAGHVIRAHVNEIVIYIYIYDKVKACLRHIRARV